MGKPYTGAFSTVDSSVKFEGVAYPLAKHGFARKREFTLIDSIADTLVYELRDNEETKKLYPCSFSFTATHKITDEVFTTTFKVKNADNKPIWFCIGGHPGFLLEEGICSLLRRVRNARPTDQAAP